MPPCTAPCGPAQQGAKENDPQDEVICKVLEAPTGSRIGKRKVCKTAREWRQQTSKAQEEAGKIQRTGVTTNNPPTEGGKN